MIIAVTVINDHGESLRMELKDPWSSGLAITDIDGIGGPDGDIQTTEIVSSDGSLFSNARAKDRKITLKLRPMAVPSVERSRHLTYRYFPVKKQVTIVFETDRRILEIDGYVRSNLPSIFAKKEEITVEIDCPRPWFRLSGLPKNVILTGVDPMFEFPFSNEDIEDHTEYWTEDIIHKEYDEFGRVINTWTEVIYHKRVYSDRDYEETTTQPDGSTLVIHHSNDLDLTNNLLIMGEIKEELQALVAYEGEADTGFVMQVHANKGPAKDIEVFNLDTGEKMIIYTDAINTITGKPFQLGDTIYISTVSGDKYAKLYRGGQWYNVINCIDKDSDWLILHPGPNLFGYSAAEDEENLTFEISYTPLYQGV